MRRTKLLIEANATWDDMNNSGIEPSAIGTERAGDGIIYSYEGEAYSHHEYEFENGKIGVASLGWTVNRDGSIRNSESAQWMTVREAKVQEKELQAMQRKHDADDWEEAMENKYQFFNTRAWDEDSGLDKKSWRFAVRYIKALRNGTKLPNIYSPSISIDIVELNPHRNA